MLNKADSIFEIQIPCDCHTEGIVIRKWDDMEDYYYLEFWAHTYYSGQGLWWTFKQRVKFAWQALRKGNYIHQEIILNRNKITELRDDLTKLLEAQDGKRED